MKTFKQFQEEAVTVNELFGLGKPKPKPKKSLARKVVGGAAKLAGKAAVGTAKVAGKVVKKVGTAAVKGAAGAVSGAAKGIASGLRDHYEIGEAKVDTVKYGTLSSPAKEKARNERKFGKVGWNQGGQSQLRKGAHWANRGEKKIKGQKPAPKGAYGEGYQRDPEQQKKERTTSKQSDPSKAGFTGISDDIGEIMRQNAAMKKAAAAKKK